jgi:antitoxin PrlF
MASVTVSNKGQVVIPADVRRQLGIEPGSQVEVLVVDGKLQIELRHPARTSSHDEGYGLLKYRGPARKLADADVAELMRREQAGR